MKDNIKVDDIKTMMNFFEYPLDGLTDGEAKNIIGEHFLNRDDNTVANKNFQKLMKKYPSLTAETLKTLQENDSENKYGISSKVNEFAESFPSSEVLKKKIKNIDLTAKGLVIAGSLGGLYFGIINPDNLAFIASFATIAPISYLAKKGNEYYSLYLFKKDFEENVGYSFKKDFEENVG